MGERKFAQMVLVTWPKMATIPIYGKNLKKSSSLEPKGLWPWILVCIIGCLSTNKFAQMMMLGWPWPILWQGQNWSLMLLYGKKVKQWIFQKLLSSMVWNYQQMTEVTRSFCWHQNFVPRGCMPSALGLYTCIKSWKKLYKISLQRDFFETCNKWVKWQAFLLTSKFCPLGGCLPLPWGYIHVLNHEKHCMESDSKTFFWNLQQMNEVTRHFCWHQNFAPWGLSAPALGLYTCVKSWKKIV